ncbi:bifunctional serine/threonine-protein kinase/ABC transporter substrate-binding protein [Nostoc sp. TCL26-01]|uniref:bifunctional serine/threonine-protein kinase/ABC transporter substrate-binding protein n=1 Tax=Nostoc sp. TCL26-01 TaxID=2576904 RepID=UPI0015BCB447|nr:bifunctional serine/threonine-protein kinase/ABC transporter substrate-binding protein [Nostoc sp. TCL26-01]QLE55789.1 serine/threonine protein kinase [Nostoc sp. TCL26-01]
MAYCINPDCSQRENPDNCAVCQTCKTPLILQNRYRIKHPLPVNQSLYTEVFEIEDVHSHQVKILKSLKENTPDLLRLFQQEATILTSLQHPGLPIGEILFFFFLNTGRQLCCFVMEKVPGENLQTWLCEHQYVESAKIVISWLKELTQILQFVHENNFFHRDIKPANIMLRPDGRLTLIDFGSARQVTQTVINNQPVTKIFSQGYTPPEQSDGHAVMQSDFYALGQTFIYLLTGINPAIAHHNLPNWSNYVKDPKTPKRLIELLQAMTNSHPHRRPQTAQAILDKIANIEKYPQKKWQKLLLSLACGVLLILGTKSLYDIITRPQTCDYIEEDHLSCGEESLIPASFWGNDQPPRIKQLAIDEYRSQNFAAAVPLFTTAFNQQPDPETLIYLNNAKIHIQFPAEKIHTIAVAVPLERRTPIGLEILRGAAQAQTEALKNGQPLRIMIADDNNRDESRGGNNARKIAQKLVKYSDMLAVLGHYSSEATKQALPIYTQAEVVVISATSTSNNLKSPFFFRTVPSDRITAQKIASYIFSQSQQRRAAIFYSQGSEYAESLSKEFRQGAKSFQGNVINHQAAFNLATDNFDAKIALNQAQTQGASAILLIPDAGVGLYNAIPNALKVIQENVNKAQIVAGDSLYSSDLITSDKIISSPGVSQTAWAIAWHPINGINSQFGKQAQTLWKIDRQTFPTNTQITWRTATSYDAVMVLSKAIAEKPSRQGIQQTLNQANFSVTSATGVIQFMGGDRRNGTINIIAIRRNCHANDFVFIAGDRPNKCQLAN